VCFRVSERVGREGGREGERERERERGKKYRDAHVKPKSVTHLNELYGNSGLADSSPADNNQLVSRGVIHLVVGPRHSCRSQQGGESE
jgi:hypothetical protein